MAVWNPELKKMYDRNVRERLGTRLLPIMADEVDHDDPGVKVRPGLRAVANRPFDAERAKERLEDTLGLIVSVENVQVVGFSADCIQAYIELKDEAGDIRIN